MSSIWVHYSIHYGEIYTLYQPVIKEVISRTNCEGKILSKEGDVLVPSTTTADAFGIAVARSLNENGIILGGDINIIRTENKYLLSDYLSYLISNSNVKKQLATFAKGVNILHLSNSDLRKLKIPLPPLEVQKEIVEQIEVKQKAIEAAKAIIQNLERERRYFGQSLRKLEGVEIMKLSDVCEINRKTAEPTKLFGKDAFAYIDISSVENGTGNLNYENMILPSKAPSRARRIIQNGDVLLSTVRPNLKAFAYLENLPSKALASTGFAVLTAKENVLAKFVFHLLFADDLQSQMAGRMGKGSYPSINQDDVEQLSIPLPSLEIQKKLVAEAEKEQQIINASKQLIEIYEKK
ncbi:MAG: restriction endonuclease subunit S [Patescibacteria group bacterium]